MSLPGWTPPPPRSRWTAALLRVLDAADDVAPGDGDVLRADLLATLRLDGSRATPAQLAGVLVDAADPTRGVTDAALAGGAGRDDEPDARRAWTDAMGNLLGAEAPEEAVLAREVAGVLGAWSLDRLVPAARTPDELDATLRRLHDVLTPGLVPSDDSGRLRATAQAVHDSSTSQILFYAPDARGVAARWEALLRGWAAEAARVGSDLHVVELAAVVHHHLAVLHPFESANGRLARTVARHLLAAHGTAPQGLDTAMAADPMRYWRQLADDEHRGHLEMGVEAFAEQLLVARTTVAGDLGAADTGWLAAAPDRFTVADARATLGTDLHEASERLLAATLAGVVVPDPGTRGLRWTRRPTVRGV